MRKAYPFLFFALLLTSSISLFSQDGSETLLTIGKTKVSKAEFERIYHKNNNTVKTSDQKSLNEYLDLFINFKLKVIEAENLQMDTTSSFKKELAGYRDQLAKTYLSSDEEIDSLVKEAYDRSKWEIDASHILVRCDENASPADTLIAFNKIQAISNRLKKGEDFSTVARESSEDPGTAKVDGHIGYFSSFQMIYPFETVAYNTPVGHISNPFRSKFGYHIIKVLNKIPSRGEVKASHIMKAFPQGSTPDQIEKARISIFALYDSLTKGADFAELAKKYSDDSYSGRNGGDLGWFSVGRMIPEFETVAFGLQKKGEYSLPFKTKFGWHIVKLIDKRTSVSFDESKEKLKQLVRRDDRSKVANQWKINSLKKEYGFSENLKNLEPFYSLVDSTIFKTPWRKEKAAGLNKPLFTIANKTATQAGFAEFLAGKPVGKPIPVASLVNNQYKEYVNTFILDYEKSKLDDKYPEFRYLMQEYHDGILLFDLTDEMVWSKALKDSAGLTSFYGSAIKIDSLKKKYMWKDRLEATIYNCSSDSLAKLARKAAITSMKKNLAKSYVYKEVVPADSAHRFLKIEEGKFEKGENAFVDEVKPEIGLSNNINKDHRVIFVYIEKKLKPELKTLDEARGLVTADYQDKLEKLWIESLRKKYSINVNRAVLSEVK